MVDITFDEITTKIMIILNANEGKILNQYKLYELVIDKFNQNIMSIPNEFKYKFMLVLRQLMSKFDDVEVRKESEVYYVSYNKLKDSNYLESLVQKNTMWLNKYELYDYIIKNDLDDEIDYADPESGNTIIHDVLGSDDVSLAKKLIDNYYVDFDVKNINNETPIDFIKNIKISNMVVKDLNVRLSLLEQRLEKLENKKSIEDFTLYEILKYKFFNYLLVNKLYIVFNVCLFFVLVIIGKIINI